MAFGTGQHATTRSCLSLIDSRIAQSKVDRALDVGTGSGILAIALAKLGAKYVVASDIDPCARQAAQINSATNGVVGSIRIVDRWQTAEPSYDLIVANLFTSLLVEMSDAFSSALLEGGALLCSGFLESDAPIVADALERSGMTISDRILDDGWVALQAGRAR